MPNDEPQAENGCATRSSLSDTLGGAAEPYKKFALVLPQSRRQQPALLEHANNILMIQVEHDLQPFAGLLQNHRRPIVISSAVPPRSVRHCHFALAML